jgi:3-oxoacyl-[acyl-carrier protein] reductase
MPQSGQPLEGRVALVTGGSSGIGRAIAIAAAGAGADVALTYRVSERAAREVADTISATGRRAAAFPMDLTDARSIESLAPAVCRALGRIDVWINNAGADILTGDARTLPPAEKLDRVLNADLRGTILASWEAARVLGAQPDGGVIINMSWDHVVTGMAGLDPQLYAAAKGGILAFSKSLARSVAPKVRVNVLAPGWIETSFAGTMTDEVHREVADRTPMKRWGTPEDIAGAAIFLASPAAAFVTGQMLMVGGGLVM